MIRVVLLPGLDGDARLRTEFAAALSPEFDADVVSYPHDAALDYDGLTAFALERLPRDSPFVLMGESFSGPIAIELAAMRPKGLMGLVLCATFAKMPRPRLAPFRHIASALPLHWLPMRLLMAIMMGRWSTREYRLRLKDALTELNRIALRCRLADASLVDVTTRLSEITCPVLYLQASHDLVVLPDSWLAIRAEINDAVCVRVEAPHMLLQAKPMACANAIKQWHSKITL